MNQQVKGEFLEVRVGIEPTNKGFADLYSTSSERRTVSITDDSDCKVASFLPVEVSQ